MAAVYDDQGTGDTGNSRKSRNALDKATGNDAASQAELKRLTGEDYGSQAGLRDQTGADEKKSLSTAKSEPEGDTGSFSFRKERMKGLAKLRAKSKKLSKNKWLIGGAAGGGLLLLGLVVLLFLIGSLIIPNFAQNMVAYSFARVARETVDSTSKVTAEKVTIDSAPDNVYEAAANEFGNEVDATTNENIWSKINNYRPQKVVDNLQATGQLEYYYGPDKSLNPLKKLTGRQTLQKIYVNGNEIDIPQNSFSTLDKILNPVDYVTGIWKSKSLLKSSLSDAMNTTFRGSNWLIRSKAARIIADDFKIKYYRWSDEDLKKLDTEDTKQADVTNQQESYEIDTAEGTAATEAEAGTSGQEQTAADEANQTIADCMQSADCTQTVIDQGGGLPQTTIDALNKIFASSILDGILKFFAPTYAIAAPLCMIYQASIVNSGGVINANEGEVQRTAYQVTTAADQQKYGNVNGNAIGAQARQMGGNSEIAQSNVMRRASGLPVDTNNSGVNPQASAGGTYTYDIFSFLGPVDNVIRPVIGGICSVFNNMWTGLGIGILLLIVPAAKAAISAAAGAAEAGISVFVSTLAKSLGSSLLKMVSKKELAKMGTIAGATIAGSLLAKYIALQHVAALNNGLSRNQDFNSRAESGAIDNSNYIERQQNYGGPMSPQATAETKAQDLGFLDHEQQTQSVYQRFFAVSNAQSFVSRLGIDAWAHMNLDTIPSLLLSAGRIFNPVSAFSGLFNLMQNKTMAAAAANVDNTDYNILQWGWTPIEEWHYEHDPNYNMLNNQKQLDQSGQEQNISSTLGKCFTTNIGQLLANGDLQRDANASILPNTGDCAPDNYSPTNRDDPTQTDNMVFASTQDQLAFRYRVAMRDQNVLNQMDSTANPSADTTGGTTTPTAGGCGGGKYGALVSSGSSFAGVDQGIDFVPGSGGKFNICAPASGTITEADQTGHIFQRTTGQAEIIEKLDAAPNAPSSSQYIYYAEIITIDPNIKVGTHVNKGDLIGTNAQSPGIEVGWATSGTQGFMCAIAYPSACGTSFNAWVQAQ